MWNVSRGRVGPVPDRTCRSDATISARDACHASARPITSYDRPQSRLYAPLEPPCSQKPLNIGLWDEWPRSTGVVRSTAWLPWRVEAMRLAGRTRLIQDRKTLADFQERLLTPASAAGAARWLMWALTLRIITPSGRPK